MLYRILADGVVVVHLSFILFVVAGAAMAWRWPALVWVHLPALAWGFGTVLVGFPCPLTPLEKGLRRQAGDEGYRGGFVDHYIEDVVYPDEYTSVLRALAAVVILVSYLRLGLGRKRAGAARRPTSVRPSVATGPAPPPATGGTPSRARGWRG